MIEYKSVSLANQVYEELENRILNGTYAPGQIITEKCLAEELKVSRTPIREALGRLAQERLIKDSPAGNVVIGVSKEDAADLFEVKRRVETLIVRKAVENITEEELEELSLILDKQEFYAMKEDARIVRDLDTDFHDLIYRASRSIMLETVLTGVHHKLLKFRKLSLEHSDRIKESVGEHRDLLDAIKSGDADLAEKMMLRHVNNACRNTVGGDEQ